MYALLWQVTWHLKMCDKNGVNSLVSSHNPTENKRNDEDDAETEFALRQDSTEIIVNYPFTYVVQILQLLYLDFEWRVNVT